MEMIWVMEVMEVMKELFARQALSYPFALSSSKGS
jgi:hypothetical protein